MQSGGRTYQVTSEVSRPSTDAAGQPAGRVFAQGVDLQLHVQHVELEHASYLSDYDDSDGEWSFRSPLSLPAVRAVVAGVESPSLSAFCTVCCNWS